MQQAAATLPPVFPSTMMLPVTRKIASYGAVTALFSVAAYLWVAPILRETQLRKASLAELKRIARGRTPEDTRLLFYLGRGYIKEGRKEGIKYLSLAANRAPFDADIWRETAAAVRMYQDTESARKLLETFVASNPENAKGRAALAEQLFREQRNTEAENEANQALKRDPNCADALRIIALCQSARNQIGEAETTLRKAIAIDPKNMLVKLSLADLLSEKRDHAAAIPLYREVLTEDSASATANTGLALSLLTTDSAEKPDTVVALALRGVQGDEGNYLAHFALGRAFQRAGDLPKAMQEFDTTRLMSPTFIEPYFQLAKTAKQAGLPDAPRWFRLHRNIQQFLSEKDIRQAKNRQAAQDPQKLRTLAHDFVRWLAKNGDYGAAISIYNDLIADDPTGTLQRERDALLASPACRTYRLLNTPTVTLMREAQRLVDGERLSEAMSFYTAAIRRNRTNGEALELAAQTALAQHDPALAVKLFKDVVRNDPHTSAAYFGLASIAADLGLEPEARWYTEKSLKEASNPAAWHLLGELSRSDVKQAETCFEHAVQGAPDNGIYHAALGEMQAANNRIAMASTTFARAVQLTPDAPEVLVSYGTFLVDHADRVTEGIQMLEKARQIAPQDAMLLYKTGMAYEKKGDTVRAISLLEAARKTGVERDATYALAQLYQKQGDTDRARLYRERAKQRQQNLIATSLETEKGKAVPPETLLQLAREHARTPKPELALPDYAAYLEYHPHDRVVLQERDALLQKLRSEGVSLVQNRSEIIAELRDYRNLTVP